MGFRESLHDEIALLNKGRPLEAFDRHFADDGVMYDNDEMFGRDKAEARAKQEPFIAAAASIRGRIADARIDEQAEMSVFRNRSSFVTASGETVQIDGLVVQRWVRGQIVEERYYRGELMEEKLASGALRMGVALG